MPQKLTVLIPCKDERKNIRACIESVKFIADEVLVADSGSIDGTLDVVRSIGGCRVIEREYVNSANFKNWAIPQARHEWVLIVDADERVTPRLADDVWDVLVSPPAHLDAYSIGRENYFMGHRIRHCGLDPASDTVIRLLRRDACRYETSRVHASVVVAPDRLGNLRGTLEHYTYWTYDQCLPKYLRYTRWSAEDLWDRGRRAGVRSLLFRPLLRFLQLYLVRLGFLDGLPGLQYCMLTAFINTYLKQARLWEFERAVPQPDPDANVDAGPRILPFVPRLERAA
jgi:glycosyltransferase involved in cell wall biosynthesis